MDNTLWGHADVTLRSGSRHQEQHVAICNEHLRHTQDTYHTVTS
jgi:hypothetical protein